MIYHSHFVTNAIGKATHYHCLTSVVATVKFTSPWRPSIGFCPETTAAVAKAASTKVPTGRIAGRRVESRCEEDLVLEKAFALLIPALTTNQAKNRPSPILTDHRQTKAVLCEGLSPEAYR